MKNILKFTGLLSLIFALSFSPVNDKKIIVLDAGHGGNDAGAHYNGLVEKDFTLALAQEIIAQNTNPNIEFVLTRSDDSYVKLTKRSEKINHIKPDLVLSLHLNKALNESTNGVEFYVSNINSHYDKSLLYAETLAEHFGNDLLHNRGVKENVFHILRNSDCPAIIAELGFVSNEKDRSYLLSQNSTKEIAGVILNFLNDL